MSVRFRSHRRNQYGAILGCAAAIGRPMASVVALYEKHGSAIFPHRIKDGYSAPF